ncbi:hypothetical protein QR680_006009 [Steinernema hermaphroditum]|uniref:Uncharacterized protein n=1 Tax=Steinernema hermaphroditum TaxID=289476 RepID=A0AA39LWD7_9BILA|nr:hypothetical protein QR680_006009 [Steinernema hermaphroditum]
MDRKSRLQNWKIPCFKGSVIDELYDICMNDGQESCIYTASEVEAALDDSSRRKELRFAITTKCFVLKMTDGGDDPRRRRSGRPTCRPDVCHLLSLADPVF